MIYGYVNLLYTINSYDNVHTENCLRSRVGTHPFIDVNSSGHKLICRKPIKFNVYLYDAH